jgi:hypothetical protein
MPNSNKATLFMVTNTKAFDSYEDHEAAIYIQLHEMVEQEAIQLYSEITLRTYLEALAQHKND